MAQTKTTAATNAAPTTAKKTSSATSTIDLTARPPRRPEEELNGFVQLGRTIDKCRAMLAKKVGDYHYDCPLDKVLFTFKGISAKKLEEQVAKGLTDQQIADWLLATGTKKTAAEIKVWSKMMKENDYYNHADAGKREWFIGACKTIGIDPAKSTLFDYLNADDAFSFKSKAK